MPTIDTAQGMLFYAESRRSVKATAPVILIHGAGSSHLGWSGELRRLQNQRVLTIDLPGHGRAAFPARNGVDEDAAAVVALMDALHIQQAILMGHSLGGAIAQTVAVQYPAQVAGLILIGTGAKLAVNPKILNGILTDYEKTAARINQWCWALETPDVVKQLGLKALLEVPAQVLYDDYVACDQFDLTAQIQNIAAPTLVIGGTADQMTPLALSEFLAAEIPQATLEIVAGGGHWMLLEQPHTVAALVSDWLEKQ